MYTWDDSYAIALALRERRPDANLDQVSLGMIYHWTLELADFGHFAPKQSGLAKS